MLPGLAELQSYTTAHGIEAATRWFYQAAVESEACRAFVLLLDGVATSTGDERGSRVAGARTTLQTPRILVVPAFFHRERPQYGGDGRFVVAAAQAAGLVAQVAQTHSRGGVSENVPLVWQALAACPDQPTWLVSLSQGGAEVRRLLAVHAGEPELANLRGWVNIGGLVRGSHWIDALLGDSFHRMSVRAGCRALGISYEGLRELCTDHPLWYGPMEVPAHVTVVNLLAVPLLEHVHPRIKGRYRQMASVGPNDGMVVLSEALVRPGWIYPVWGTDHFFQGAGVQPLLDRLFRWIRADVRL